MSAKKPTPIRRQVTIERLDFYKSSTREPRWDITFTDGTTARTEVGTEFAYVIQGFAHGQTLEGFFSRPDRLTWARVLKGASKE